MSLITKPKLENRQFEQPKNSTLDMSGTTNFLGVLKSKDVEIDASISGDTNFDEYALVYDNETGKIKLREVVARYTGTAERTVGGIREGQKFTEATMTEMWNNLILEEKIPVIVAPSITTFTSSETGFREIGSLLNITYNITFNKGKIEIVSTTYNSFKYRTGEIEKYVYSGPSLDVENITTSTTNSASLTNYKVVIGTQSWNCRVYFLDGPQPLTSYGNTEYYNETNQLVQLPSLYPAGNILSTNRTVTGVYPFFATTSNITTLTKRPLQGHGTSIDVTLVAESTGNKQKVEVPDIWGTLSKIEQFNDLSGQWDIININSFTISTTTKTINDNIINYNLFTHNGSLIGSRRLRFTF